MVLSLFSRILLATPFVVLGLLHFVYTAELVQITPIGGQMMVYLTGIAAVAASIAFVTGKEARTAGLLTAALMFTYVFVLHIPTIVSASDRMMQLVSIANAVKDLGLAGGALMVAQTHRIKVSTESSAPTA